MAYIISCVNTLLKKLESGKCFTGNPSEIEKIHGLPAGRQGR